MAKSRRLWCACTIIDYLKGEARAKACEVIIEHAGKGELEIAVSMLAHVEVVKIGGSSTDEAMIQEFFRRSYVISIQVDRRVAEEARQLVRLGLMKKPLDAVHAASAIVHKIPILETYNVKDFKRVIGHGDLAVREPVWDPLEPTLDL